MSTAAVSVTTLSDEDRCHRYGHVNCAVHDKPDAYDPKLCRLHTWQSLLANWDAGRCRAVGVNNWNASDIAELEEAGVMLPSVAQYKFHLHASTASAAQRELLAYCKERNIIFNGFAPLGVPDWVTFTGAGMTSTTLEEPAVQAIAQAHGKSAAQVMLRWAAQQGIATQPRTMQPAHMEENLDVFDWELTAAEIERLSSMPQCNVTRGNPYVAGDPNGGARHGNVVGITAHC